MNGFPFDGTPQDMKEVILSYFEWLKQPEIPKLLFYGEPGVLITKDWVEWCKENLTNLTAANIGPGIHQLQEDILQLIGRNFEKRYSTIVDLGKEDP